MILLNNEPINVTMFPDKTSQVWKIKNINQPDIYGIVWKFEHESEFMHLAQLKVLLDEMKMPCYLKITYLPYARQDKDVSNDSTFALHAFAKLLNCLNFSSIFILDPHNPALTVNLIRNSIIVYPIEEIKWCIKNSKPDLICYADTGALVKYREYIDHDHIQGQKSRSQTTGEILSYKIIDSCSVENKKILIVDDICDGGMTFIMLTKQLLEAKATEVNLFVTHGLFTKGTQCLYNVGIGKIYTKNGMEKR